MKYNHKVLREKIRARIKEYQERQDLEPAVAEQVIYEHNITLALLDLQEKELHERMIVHGKPSKGMTINITEILGET